MTNHKRAPDLSPSNRNLICQFLIANNTNGVVHKGKVKEAVSSFGVNRKTIQYAWKAARQQVLDGVPILFTSKKMGIQGKVKVQLDVQMMKSIPFEKRGTIRRLSKALNVSKSTVGRWIKQGLIKPHINAIKPDLTEANKLLRLKYNLNALKFDRQANNIKFQTMHNVIHIDEKWFYMTKTNGRYYPFPGEIEPYKSCKSKRYIPKIMFMCAVARPHYSTEGELIFDEKISIFPFTKMVPAQRNGKNR